MTFDRATSDRASGRNDTRVATARGWSSHGEAVFRDSHGRLVAVWAGIPGEACRVSLKHEGRNRVDVRWESPIEAPHEGRRHAPCARFHSCGGCPMMHLEPDWQRRARLAAARAAFRLEGVGDLVPKDVVPSPVGDDDYRHVVKLNAGRSDIGRPRLGTYQRGSHRVLPIPDCNVATPVLRELMTVVSHHFIALDVFPYDEEDGSGTLRHVVMRQSRATGQVLVTLVVTRIDKRVRELADAIIQGHGAVAGVAAHINDQRTNAIYATPEPREDDEKATYNTGFKRIAGAPVIEEKLHGVRLRIGPGDFYQANPAVADVIAADLLELLEPWAERPVADLYCGVGGFTLVLAKRHGWAFGAEAVPGAVRRAVENAQLNHISAEFDVGRVAELLPALKTRLGDRAPVVMLDPARRGLEPGVVDGVVDLKPSAVAYLSCNPLAMARDLVAFRKAGWNVETVRAYDMFPQTTHLEMLALLTPPEAPVPARRAPRRRIVR